MFSNFHDALRLTDSCTFYFRPFPPAKTIQRDQIEMTSPLPLIRICLADDHPLIVEGIRWVLSQARHIRIDGVAQDPDGLLALLAISPCDVLVTDFHMPGNRGADGLAMLGMIRRLYPDLPILVLTSLCHAGLFQSIRRLGVTGILRKDNSMSELAVAIRTVHLGGTWHGTPGPRSDCESDFSRHVSTTPISFDALPEDSHDATLLSPSEIEVLRLYAGGMSVSEVSERLNRSIKTVSTHKRKTMKKLGIHTDTDLFQYAQKNGLA